MKVSAGTRSTAFTSDRQVTIHVTGIAQNDFVRTADTTLQVPYSRMNETMRMVQRMGGRITDVNVSGGDLGNRNGAEGKAASKPRRRSRAED
jgi:phycocyanin-associated rod protein